MPICSELMLATDQVAAAAVISLLSMYTCSALGDWCHSKQNQVSCGTFVDEASFSLSLLFRFVATSPEPISFNARTWSLAPLSAIRHWCPVAADLTRIQARPQKSVAGKPFVAVR